MGNELVSTNRFKPDEMERMCVPMVKSNFFGIRNLDEGLTLMYMAEAEGRHPATAFREYHVIKGKPTLSAEAMLARFQNAGGVVEWQEYSDEKCSALFSHPKACPKPVLIEWDMMRARKADLAGKSNWAKTPRAMLKARVCSEGVRACYPACVLGLYTPEEVTTGDFGGLPETGVQNPGTTRTEQIAAQIKSKSVSEAIMEGESKGEILDAEFEELVGSSDINDIDYHAQREEDQKPVKERGDAPEVIGKIMRAKLPRRVTEIFMTFDKDHLFTKTERDQIKEVADKRIDHLQSISAKKEQESEAHQMASSNHPEGLEDF